MNRATSHDRTRRANVDVLGKEKDQRANAGLSRILLPDRLAL